MSVRCHYFCWWFSWRESKFIWVAFFILNVCDWQPERIQPPEHTKGYDVRSDVWSLGISCYELATGRFPYPLENWTNVFQQLDQVVNGPAPRLTDDYLSENFRNFVNIWYDFFFIFILFLFFSLFLISLTSYQIKAWRKTYLYGQSIRILCNTRLSSNT
jgi:serine/threonine protein kinase